MTEGAQILRDLRLLNRIRKQNNLQNSTDRLREAGIKFYSSNGGLHLIVHAQPYMIDFWPTTGKWKSRRPGASARRGVFNLIEYIQENSDT